MTNVLEPHLDDPVDTPESFARGLRGYVDEVARAVGVGLESCAIDPYPPASVYVALDTKLAGFPGRDLALLWDERFGWSAAVETHSGEDLIVIAYRGGELLPDPSDVAAFVAALADSQPDGRCVPRQATAAQRQAMLRTLREYMATSGLEG
jgi:hypothetical protein